jgi:tetratricopeptide (TPR) repeat protein
MLFDLRGKRRRLVQVVYAVLAFLFAVGFLFFFIGSDVGGGGSVFEAVGIGGEDTSTSSQYDSEIDEAEQKLEQNPKDENALIELARLHFLAGQGAVEQDPETGQPVVTDDARVELDESVSAWERYLKLEPKKPDPNAAGLVVQAYVLLNDAKGAAETQEIVAEDRPSQNAYGSLALYLYAAGDIEGGDEAAKRAVAEAEPSQRSSLKKQLAQTKKLAERQQEQLKKQAQQAPEGQNPLQAPLGPGGPGSPIAPAPTAP